AERMKDTARAAARLGVTQVNGFTGSSVWHLIYSFPPNDLTEIDRAYEDFADRAGGRSSTSSMPRGFDLGLRSIPPRLPTTSSRHGELLTRSTTARPLASTSTRATSPTSS